MAIRVRKPPPILGDCRVTHYAVRSRRVPFVGPTSIFVGQKELKPLGAVPCLALGESRSGEIVLFYCTRRWSAKGVAHFDSVKKARAKAERNYPSVSKLWKKTGYTKSRVKQYRRLIWKGLECSFCGRLPIDFEGMVENGKGTTRVCNICAKSIAEILLKPNRAAVTPSVS